MAELSLTFKFPQLTAKRLLIAGGGLAVSLLVAGVVVYLNRPTDPLTSIVGPINAFTPYFFNQIPDGYTVDKAHSLYADKVLQVTLQKPGKPSLVLDEQALPRQLSAATLLSSGSQVKGTIGSATVNTVDEHVVGTLVPTSNNTLVLVTGPDAANTNDVIDLLRAIVVE